MLRRFKFHQSKLSSALLLGLYAIVTIATSVRPNGEDYLFQTKSYSVSTNCGNATMTTGQITVTEQRITNPSDTNFLAIGIPTETLDVGSDISGELAPALTRTCAHSLDTSVPNTTISVYTCEDNGIPSCILNLTHLN